MLTNMQRKLVEQNHNLIYSFAKAKKLDIEEYYDILAIALCEAAEAYDPDIGEFSTIANTYMYNRYINHYKHMNTAKSGSNKIILSYDAPIDKENSKEGVLIDRIDSGVDVSETVIGNIVCADFMKLLTDKEVEVVNSALHGLSQSQIAKKIKTTQPNICFIMKKIRTKWNKYACIY